MSNHPNRGWRSRMQAAADQWLIGEGSRLTGALPSTEPERGQELRLRVRLAYISGYQDGRPKIKPIGE